MWDVKKPFRWLFSRAPFWARSTTWNWCHNFFFEIFEKITQELLFEETFQPSVCYHGNNPPWCPAPPWQCCHAPSPDASRCTKNDRGCPGSKKKYMDSYSLSETYLYLDQRVSCWGHMRKCKSDHFCCPSGKSDVQKGIEAGIRGDGYKARGSGGVLYSLAQLEGDPWDVDASPQPHQ